VKIRDCGPLAEEVVFRGSAFWFLDRLAIWQFWPAVRVPALFFAVGHQHRAQDTASTAGIFAITTLGDGLANLARVLTIGLSNMPAVCRDRLPGFGHRVP